MRKFWFHAKRIISLFVLKWDKDEDALWFNDHDKEWPLELQENTEASVSRPLEEFRPSLRMALSDPDDSDAMATINWPKDGRSIQVLERQWGVKFTAGYFPFDPGLGRSSVPAGGLPFVWRAIVHASSSSLPHHRQAVSPNAGNHKRWTIARCTP
ncbi:hypothetical protein B0H19DRAFT_1066566 [Mycena capillaripes]|nr:hypothetical protein B0H19DRAFT_1066566 [Mycena capillaripes]